MRSFISVDDSGARHPGRNGYVTQMGNDFLAWFSSTESKSRINFLQLPQAGTPVYRLDDEALAYWREQGLPQALCPNRMVHPTVEVVATAAGEQRLDDWGLVTERHRRSPSCSGCSCAPTSRCMPMAARTTSGGL